MFKENHRWLYPAAVPVEMPVGLIHVDSDFCWCDRPSSWTTTEKKLFFTGK
jgi:hypothetical protein